MMDATHPRLLRYAARITGDEETAYDILQDAYIKVWRMRDSLDPERSLKALLYRIVYTLGLNHNRMKKREKEAVSAMQSTAESNAGMHASTSAQQPDEALDAQQLGVHMGRWIAELPPRRQEAFRLSRFEGLSHEEIAHVMELSPQTVTKHIMLALQFLRDRFQRYQTSELGS